MSSPLETLRVTARTVQHSCVLTADGVLDSSTYLQLREAIVKAALDEPRAVVVDVSGLEAPAPSAWSVFTSARWLVDTWPAVPIHLVCDHDEGRDAVARNGITRYVHIHPTVDAALDALVDVRGTRLRTRMELPAAPCSLRMARGFVAQRLTEWGVGSLVAVATVIVNVFIENVLQHTAEAPALVLETDGSTVAVSVRDGSPHLAARHEDSFRGGEQISGLAIVASISRAWGCTPTLSGKTVWAVVGPENRL